MKFLRSLCLLMLSLGTGEALAEDATPIAYIQGLESLDYLESVARVSDEAVSGYLVPLGAIQKVRGVWAPRDQERVSGVRQAMTWRLLYGFTSAELMAEIDDQLGSGEQVSSLFSCDARACGASVQWANRIFKQRLLYGREKSQSYRAMKITDGDDEYRLLIYASARSTDRQYLHMELIAIDEVAQ